MNFSQGDIVIIPVPFTDNKGNKLRPAVVISNQLVHQTAKYKELIQRINQIIQ